MTNSTTQDYEPDFEQQKLEAAVAFMEAEGIEKAEADLKQASEATPSTPTKEKRETPDNSGSMFKNDRKSKEAHPDISGSALVGGAEYWVSGWRKSGTKGDFYSLSFKVKDAPAAVSELI